MGMKMWLMVWFLLSLLCPCKSKPMMATRIAKPGCQYQCGDMLIPYPFGIGDVRCAKNDKFLVQCKNGTVPLLLGSIPVRNISLHHGMVTITMKTSPICYNNNPGAKTKLFYGGINLSGTPFMFSRTHDTFVVFGCNVAALIIKEGELPRGCVSVCNDSKDPGEGSCSGFGCCQTTIPRQLKSLNLTIFSIHGSYNHEYTFCLHGFLAAMGTFHGSRRNHTNLPNHNMPSQVILDWAVGEERCKAAGDSSGTYACGRNTVCLDSSKGHGYRCICKRGFWGNPYLSQGCQGGYRRLNGTILALAICLSIGFLLVIAGLYWLYQVMKKRKMTKLKKMFFQRNGGLLLQQQISSDKGKLEKIKLFSSEELEKATDHSSETRILGKGSQGTVYKGMLPDGSVVAVKKSENMNEGRIEHFINEVVILSQINHRHVVKLLGCCLETEVPLLVYEFVSNGTLSSHIHYQMEESPMKWSDRLRIAKEVAGALAYMHSAADVLIYHRDIKSSNILLDGKYRAKLSDFGISRSVPTEKTHLTTCVQGTFGYLDPEYFQSRHYTEKSDVYSFGVVLLELLTGQKPISSDRSEDLGLAAHFIASAKENCLFEVLDPQVVIEGEREEIVTLANLAMRCLKLNGRKRPTMKEVSLELENLKKPQEHLPSELDHQEADCSIIESSTSLNPSDIGWAVSGEIREEELDIYRYPIAT